MKLGLVVNVLSGNVAGQTTYRLVLEAVRRGHDVSIMSPAAMAYEPDGRIRGLARTFPGGDRLTSKALGHALKDETGRRWITVDDLDILLLRNNPAPQRAWAQFAGINFGRLAMRHGVVVLNDPNGLSKAMNKLYLQTFPEDVRPKTLVTRNKKRILAFARSEGTIVIKPLQGSGGQNVFIVRQNDLPNLEQMIDAIVRDGFVVAQEYLPSAAEGDTRLFLMNGQPLMARGKYAAFRRVRTGDDMRSNVSAGGRIRRAAVDEQMLRLADMIRPRLVEDGMFLVGLDVVGDKLMEINVFSPGGLGSAQKLEKVDFCVPLVDALERKVQYMAYYRRTAKNVDLATL
jgi:glutathione synthase